MNILLKFQLLWWVGLAPERCTLTCLMCVLLYFHILLTGDFFASVLCLHPSLFCVFPMFLSHILSYTWPVLIYLDTHTHTTIWTIASSDFLICMCLELTLYCLGSWSWAERRTGFASLHSCWLTAYNSSCRSMSL